MDFKIIVNENSLVEFKKEIEEFVKKFNEEQTPNAVLVYSQDITNPLQFNCRLSYYAENRIVNHMMKGAIKKQMKKVTSKDIEFKF